MTEFEVKTFIAASPERCFDLARDVDFHARSLAHTGERVVERTGQGLLVLEDEVTFEGRHFGVRQRLRARITAFDRPRYFRDEMVRGAFRSFLHDHVFEPTSGGTMMRDRLQFAAPGWPLGVLVERFVLRPYLARLVAARGHGIRQAAENGNGD